MLQMQEKISFTDSLQNLGIKAEISADNKGMIKNPH